MLWKPPGQVTIVVFYKTSSVNIQNNRHVFLFNFEMHYVALLTNKLVEIFKIKYRYCYNGAFIDPLLLQIFQTLSQILNLYIIYFAVPHFIEFQVFDVDLNRINAFSHWA